MPGTDRQPSSPGHALVAGPQQLGVDQHQALVAFFRHVDHDQALVHVDLGGGQADALGLVHGLEHVVDQPLQGGFGQFGGGNGDRLGAQARVGEFEDGEQGHGGASGT
jgi:hypothetical protein